MGGGADLRMVHTLVVRRLACIRSKALAPIEGTHTVRRCGASSNGC